MTARVDCPYVGLVPYTEDEARFFFGRENDQRVIISNLFASRLTILYGSSGVGKSSVLRAGVIRELRDRAEAEPDIAVVYLNDWKGDALSLLKQRINDTLLALGHAPPPAPANRTLRESLRHSSQTFDGDVMIILDQFEEYFLYHQRDVSPGSFAYEFADAANDAGLPVSFMVSMRDDALSRLDRFKSLIPNLFSNYLRIRHLTREQAQSAITRPIEAYNRLPESHRSHPGTMAIEPLLIGKILDEVRQDRVLIGESGRGVVSGAESEGIETPYLQLVLTKVWAEETGQGSTLLRAATLSKLGGAAQIVGTHVAGVLETLTEGEKAICARIFQFLVTPGGTKIAHALSDLADFAGVPDVDLVPVLERLSGSRTRILSPVAATGGEGTMRYEIYHDSLAQAILDWRKHYVDRKAQEEKDRDWAAETQRQQEVVDQARALATAQRERAEAQTRNIRLLRGMLAVLVAFLALTVAMAGYAWTQRRVARENERRALASEQRALESEKRALVSEQLAQESARVAQEARADAAVLAARYARTNGDLLEAQRFRQLAEQAAADAKAWQQKSAENVRVVLDAQRERDDLSVRLDRAQQEIARLRSASPVQQTAPPELTVLVRLLRIVPLNEGTSRGEWNFSVRTGNFEVITRPGAIFDLGAETGPNSDGRIPTREGATIPLTFRGVNRPSGLVVDGAHALYIKPLARFAPETINVPVVHGNDPEKSAFVLVLEVRAVGGAAR